MISSIVSADALLAMNEVFGRFFDVDPLEMFEPELYAQAGAPRDLFVFDDAAATANSNRFYRLKW